MAGNSNGEVSVEVSSPEASSVASSPVSGNEVIQKDNNEFTFSKNPSFEELRQLLSDFAQARNWNQFHQPRNLLLALVGEIGELAELFQWKGEVKEGLPDWTEEEKTHLSEELSDVLIYLVRLADKCNVDLPAAAVRKISLNALKYPAKRVWGSYKKYNEYKE